MSPQERIKKVFLDTNFYYNVEKEQIDLFIDAVKRINSQAPTMIEIGVGHLPTYSQAFNAFFGGKCTNICTDILEKQIIECKKVFPEAIYYHGYSGKPIHYGEDVPNKDEKLIELKLTDIITQNNIEKVDMLHFDVQGSEVYILQEILENKLYPHIDNMFISVHTNNSTGYNTFDDCVKLIDSCGVYQYKFRHPYFGGYGDGLIVIEKV